MAPSHQQYIYYMKNGRKGYRDYARKKDDIIYYTFNTEILSGFEKNQLCDIMPLLPEYKTPLRDLIKKFSQLLKQNKINITFVEENQPDYKDSNILAIHRCHTDKGFASLVYTPYPPSLPTNKVNRSLAKTLVINTNYFPLYFFQSAKHFSIRTIFHELCHAIGLQHPKDKEEHYKYPGKMAYSDSIMISRSKEMQNFQNCIARVGRTRNANLEALAKGCDAKLPPAVLSAADILAIQEVWKVTQNPSLCFPKNERLAVQQWNSSMNEIENRLFFKPI